MFAEQQDVLGRNLDKTLEFDDLNKFDLLFNCIRETLRMHPPLLMLMRHCRADLPVTASDGTSYVVPKVSTHTERPTASATTTSTIPPSDWGVDPSVLTPLCLAVCLLCAQGSTVAVSPTVQHRLGSLFKEPDTFDPDRYKGLSLLSCHPRSQASPPRTSASE